MQNRFFRLIVFVITLLTCSKIAFPCGDKFLVVGRGMRYGTAKYPAAILFYSHNTDQAKDLESVLKMAGHKIQTVSSETQLLSSVNAVHYDLVLMDLDDALLLEKQVEATTNKPAVVPVIYSGNGAQLTGTAAKYDCILRGEKKNRNLVKVVDAVMEEKSKGAPLKCEWNTK